MEWRRTLLSKTFLFLLIAMIFLNGFIFLQQQTDYSGDFRSFPEMYHTVVEEYKENGIGPVIAFDDRAYDHIVADPTWGQQPENYLRLQAGDQVMAQYAYLQGYDQYIQNIQTQAKTIQAVSIFSDPDSFAYRNTVKTAEDFAPLLGVEVTFGHDLAVTKALEDEWMDYSCLLLLMVVCSLFLAERKEGLWFMIHAASGGRVRLAVRRIGILFLAAFVSTFALFGSKILLSGWLYHGLGEWDRILQSIPIFYNVPKAMTVGEFWIFYLVVKALGNFLVGLMLWTILSSVSNVALSFCAAGLVFGAEFVCTAILPGSMFAVLRYCNIFSYIRYFEVFSTYLNLPVFGLLVSGSDLVLILLLPLCLGLSVLVLVVARRKHPVTQLNPIVRFGDRIFKCLDPRISGGTQLGQESKKLLWKRKGIFLMAVLLVVASQMPPPDREYDPLDMYYHHYQTQYAGPITQQTLAYLIRERETTGDDSGFAALTIMIRQAEQAPADSYLVPEAPYEAIWSQNYGNYHRTTGLTALLFLVLLLAPINAQERQSGMTILLRSTSGGRQRLRQRKQLLLLLVTVAVWTVVYGGELLKTMEYWGSFQCLAAPTYSLQLFRESGWSLSLGWMMALYYGAKLLVLLAVGEVCFFLSGLCAKNRDATLLCCGVVLIPTALAAIGSAVGERLSFLLPLGGVELFSFLMG